MCTGDRKIKPGRFSSHIGAQPFTNCPTCFRWSLTYATNDVLAVRCVCNKAWRTLEKWDVGFEIINATSLFNCKFLRTRVKHVSFNLCRAYYYPSSSKLSSSVICRHSGRLRDLIWKARRADFERRLTTALSECKQLRSASFHCGRRPMIMVLTAELVKSVCKNLLSVQITNCPKDLTDASVGALATSCPDLRWAEFSTCDTLTGASVEALLTSCRQLQFMRFFWCAAVRSVDASALQTTCPQLQSVDFSRCERLTDEGVQAVTRNCPKLQSASFSHCYRLTDASVMALASNSKDLRWIEFNECTRLTYASAEALSTFPQLQSVELYNCVELLTDAAVKALVRTGACVYY